MWQKCVEFGKFSFAIYYLLLYVLKEISIIYTILCFQFIQINNNGIRELMHYWKFSAAKPENMGFFQTGQEGKNKPEIVSNL